MVQTGAELSASLLDIGHVIGSVEAVCGYLGGQLIALLVDAEIQCQ